MGMPAPAVVIFGAGKTGRGFAAHLCARAGRPFVLVDRDASLLAALERAGSYQVAVLGRVGDDASEASKVRVALAPERCAHVDGDVWLSDFAAAELCFTAVFGNNLVALGKRLAAALLARDPSRPLDIVTCENLSRAAAVLRAAVAAELPAARRDAILARVGFVEGIVLKTCLGPGAGDHPLLVRAQDLFRLPCDADAFVGAHPDFADLERLHAFEHQLVRKIYTYNCINAVISYVGAARGHRELSAAALDPMIVPLAIQAGDEAGRALVAEFGFDPAEQRTWADSAMAKFRDPAIPDPIERNAADPARKLARDDRLIGPALLALKHGIEPAAIARGIVAAAAYRDAGRPSPLEAAGGSLPTLLTTACGLSEREPLFALVVRVAAHDSSAAAMKSAMTSAIDPAIRPATMSVSVRPHAS